MDDAHAHPEPQPAPEHAPDPGRGAVLHVEPTPWVAEALKRCELAEDILAHHQRQAVEAEARLATERRYLNQAEECAHLLAALRQAAEGRHHVVLKTEPHPTAAGAQQFHLEDGSIAVLWHREPAPEVEPDGSPPAPPTAGQKPTPQARSRVRRPT